MLKNSNLNKNIYTILEGIYYIYNSTSLEELEFLYITSSRIKTDFYTTISLESSIRKEYAKMYSESLYQLNEKHKLNEKHSLFKENRLVYDTLNEAEYKGKKPEIYVLDGDFNLQIHVLGAYREWTRPDNFKDDWERPKIAHHGICTSYIGNNQIANAKIKHPVYGFSKYEESALLCLGNYDLFSDESIEKFATGINKPYAFYPPKDLINHTRHTHNELVLERRLNKTGQSFKRTPDYVIYFVDDINNLDNYSKKNNLFEETLAAAIDQNIPIIIVDRLKYAKSETAKCQNLLQHFKETLDLNSLEELIVTFMNNTIGCINYSDDNKEYCNYFNGQKFSELYSKILDIINSLKVKKELKSEIVTKLISILQLEYLKIVEEKNKTIQTTITYMFDFETKINNLIALQKTLTSNVSNITIQEERELINKKREIILYFYDQPPEIRIKIKKDIEQQIDIDEILNKIKNNSYNGNKVL